jgi:SWI/SNF-related matrix-associated actin-dependent regulator 1 of chromatin subfamily A
MKVVFTNGVYRCRCAYDDRHIPHRAGFRWDNENKLWYTPSYGVAARLSEYFDESASVETNRLRIQIHDWVGGLSVPKGEKLLPFQKKAARFALSRNRSYLALDPGLGKTPIAAVIAESLNRSLHLSVVYICPPFLTRNTEIEFQKWAPSLDVERYFPGCPPTDGVFIVPDSMIAKDDTKKAIGEFVKANSGRGHSTLLFADEAHRYKNDDAARTRALFGKPGVQGIADKFLRVVYLSGTPMPNRPIELYPVLNHSAGETIDFMSKYEYAKKYCAAFRGPWGWDFTGASNLDELASRVKGTFMLRYTKKEVLKELPAKTEEMVVLNDTLPPKLTKLSSEILKGLSKDDVMSGKISTALQTGELHLATYRKELGALKVKPALEFLKFLLEESTESVLIFAHHKEVIKKLTEGLEEYEPLVITGETRMELRHAYVKEFQTNPRRRVFIGNIQAAGTGFTLTKATRVVFVEFSWVPGDNDQASDRAHRIGQKDNVLVQYLVHEGSVDQRVIETVLSKKKVTAHI